MGCCLSKMIKIVFTSLLSLSRLELEHSLCWSLVQNCKFSNSCMALFMLEHAGMDNSHCALCISDIPFPLVISSVVLTLFINVCSIIRSGRTSLCLQKSLLQFLWTLGPGWVKNLTVFIKILASQRVPLHYPRPFYKIHIAPPFFHQLVI